jgi:hypothetical protein
MSTRVLDGVELIHNRFKVVALLPTDLAFRHFLEWSAMIGDAASNTELRAFIEVMYADVPLVK